MYKISEFTKPVYKAGEVAKILGITTQTLRVYQNNGKIRYFRSEGGHRLVKREDLLSFLREKGILVDDTLKRDVIYVRVEDTGETAEEKLNGQALQIVTSYFYLQNPVVIEDVGSNQDDRRKGLRALISMVLDGGVNHVYVLRRDILAGIGYGYLEYVFQQKGVSIIPLHD